jgi:hypothetical protein
LKVAKHFNEAVTKFYGRCTKTLHPFLELADSFFEAFVYGHPPSSISAQKKALHQACWPKGATPGIPLAYGKLVFCDFRFAILRRCCGVSNVLIFFHTLDLFFLLSFCAI